jgi:hypothetical protein
MIGNYFARLTGSKRNLLALLASSVVLTAGCANMSSTAPTGGNPFVSPATLSGKIHGGNQPVTGATVTLWFAGQSGNAIQAASTISDSQGNFSFTKDSVPGNPADNGSTSTYSCPTNTDPLVYVRSLGGNTQNNGNAGQNNAAAGFIAIYGDCSTLSASNFVFMSEVTTVATMAAVTQFFNPVGDTISADGTGQQKIIIDNLPNTVALLANAQTGLYVPSTSIGVQTTSGPTGIQPNIAPGVTVTATPEPGKINLLANIISACVNSADASGAGCTTLFANAATPIPNTTSLNPHSFSPATDTLQALYYIFTNPTNSTSGTSNLANLFALAGGAGAPYQPSASQPTDWTIGISYASTSTCGSGSGGTGGFISSPVDINIDATDNVWIANSQTGGNLSGINQAGAPFACVNLDAGTSAGGATVDSVGNVWMGAGTTMYRYNPKTKTPVAFPVSVSPLGVTADGLGTVYFTAVSGSVGSLYGLFGAVSAPSATPLPISNLLGTSPMRLMPDFQSNTTQSNIWVSSGANFVSQVAPSSSSGGGVLNGFLTTSFPVSGLSYGLSIGRNNNIFTTASDTGAISQLAFNGGTWIVPNGWPFLNAASAGISSPTQLSVDGRQNTWIPNHANGTSTGSISSVSVDSTALSLTTGYQKDATFLHSGRALVIDQAGNIWVAGDGNNFITEFVGAGVPLYQPFAAGLANGRFQQIP